VIVRHDLAESARQQRKAMTPAEACLWQAIRRRRLGGLKFRRQHPSGPSILAFYCSEHRLVVEVDGGVHAGQRAYDEARSEHLAAHGYCVIRFSNGDVLNNLDTVLSLIAKAVPTPPASPE
jgi:very-short-patch-repair endonuclease